MPKNSNSSSGMAEDMIRAFVQMGCAETHLKTLYEKCLAEVENGLIEIDNAEEYANFMEREKAFREDLIETAKLRRRMMLKCFEMFDGGDKDAWCMVKHLGIANMCAWETWQASDDDPDLLNIAIESNKLFVKYLTRFFGMEITDCASCLNDMLKAKES